MNVVGVSGRSTNPKAKIAAVAAVAPNAWPRSAGLGRLNADRRDVWASPLGGGQGGLDGSASVDRIYDSPSATGVAKLARSACALSDAKRSRGYSQETDAIQV